MILYDITLLRRQLKDSITVILQSWGKAEYGGIMDDIKSIWAADMA